VRTVSDSAESIPRLQFDDAAAEFVAEAFGWEAEEGIIVDADTRQPVWDHRGRTVMVDNLGGVVANEDGDPVPIRAEFTSLVDVVRSRGATADD